MRGETNSAAPPLGGAALVLLPTLRGTHKTNHPFTPRTATYDSLCARFTPAAAIDIAGDLLTHLLNFGNY